MGLTFTAEISVGDVLTIVSIAITVIALIISWNKDRELKRKEYADRIRRAASIMAANLERWKELSHRFFEDIQPLISDMDMMLVTEQDVVSVRDRLWFGLVAARTKSSQRITEEQIEMAYADLYGYNPRIRPLFNEALERLKLIDEGTYEESLYLTQADVLSLQTATKPFNSAQLGNQLRDTCRDIAMQRERLMNDAIAPFDAEMIKLIEASDQQLVSKKIRIQFRQDIYPRGINELREYLIQKVVNSRLASFKGAAIQQNAQDENESPESDQVEEAFLKDYQQIIKENRLVLVLDTAEQLSYQRDTSKTKTDESSEM